MLAEPAKLCQFYRRSEAMLTRGQTPMVPSGLQHRAPNWMTMNPTYLPTKAPKTDADQASSGYDDEPVAYCALALHQLCIQALNNWNKFKLDEIVQVWLEWQSLVEVLPRQ